MVMYDVNSSQILQTGLYKCTVHVCVCHCVLIVIIQLKRYGNVHTYKHVVSQLHWYSSYAYVLRIICSTIKTLLYNSSQLKFHDDFCEFVDFCCLFVL